MEFDCLRRKMFTAIIINTTVTNITTMTATTIPAIAPTDRWSLDGSLAAVMSINESKKACSASGDVKFNNASGPTNSIIVILITICYTYSIYIHTYMYVHSYIVYVYGFVALFITIQ